MKRIFTQEEYERLERIGLYHTACLACEEETLYAVRDGPMRKDAPKTCGRLACMVKVGDTEPVS